MCRLIEAASGKERPQGRTPIDLLRNMIDEETREVCAKMTGAAMLYFLERLGAADTDAGPCIEVCVEVKKSQLSRRPAALPFNAVDLLSHQDAH